MSKYDLKQLNQQRKYLLMAGGMTEILANLTIHWVTLCEENYQELKALKEMIESKKEEEQQEERILLLQKKKYKELEAKKQQLLVAQKEMHQFIRRYPFIFIYDDTGKRFILKSKKKVITELDIIEKEGIFFEKYFPIVQREAQIFGNRLNSSMSIALEFIQRKYFLEFGEKLVFDAGKYNDPVRRIEDENKSRFVDSRLRSSTKDTNNTKSIKEIPIKGSTVVAKGDTTYHSSPIYEPIEDSPCIVHTSEATLCLAIYGKCIDPKGSKGYTNCLTSALSNVIDTPSPKNKDCLALCDSHKHKKPVLMRVCRNGNQNEVMCASTLDSMLEVEVVNKTEGKISPSRIFDSGNCSRTDWSTQSHLFAVPLSNDFVQGRMKDTRRTDILEVEKHITRDVPKTSEAVVCDSRMPGIEVCSPHKEASTIEETPIYKKSNDPFYNLPCFRFSCFHDKYPFRSKIPIPANNTTARYTRKNNVENSKKQLIKSHIPVSINGNSLNHPAALTVKSLGDRAHKGNVWPNKQTYNQSEFQIDGSCKTETWNGQVDITANASVPQDDSADRSTRQIKYTNHNRKKEKRSKIPLKIKDYVWNKANDKAKERIEERLAPLSRIPIAMHRRSFPMRIQGTYALNTGRGSPGRTHDLEDYKSDYQSQLMAFQHNYRDTGRCSFNLNKKKENHIIKLPSILPSKDSRTSSRSSSRSSLVSVEQTLTVADILQKNFPCLPPIQRTTALVCCKDRTKRMLKSPEVIQDRRADGRRRYRTSDDKSSVSSHLSTQRKTSRPDEGCLEISGIKNFFGKNNSK